MAQRTLTAKQNKTNSVGDAGSWEILFRWDKNINIIYIFAK